MQYVQIRLITRQSTKPMPRIQQLIQTAFKYPPVPRQSCCSHQQFFSSFSDWSRADKACTPASLPWSTSSRALHVRANRGVTDLLQLYILYFKCRPC